MDNEAVEQYGWAVIVFGGFDKRQLNQCIMMKHELSTDGPPGEKQLNSALDDLKDYWGKAPEGEKRPEWLVACRTLVTAPAVSALYPGALAIGWERIGEEFVNHFCLDEGPTVLRQENVGMVICVNAQPTESMKAASRKCRAGMDLGMKLEKGDVALQMQLAGVWDRAQGSGLHEFEIIGAFINCIMAKTGKSVKASLDCANMLVTRMENVAHEKRMLLHRLEGEQGFTGVKQ